MPTWSLGVGDEWTKEAVPEKRKRGREEERKKGREEERKRGWKQEGWIMGQEVMLVFVADGRGDGK